MAFNSSSEINCALWIDRLAGLKNEHQLTLQIPDSAVGDAPAFVGKIYSDQAGYLWQELHLSELALDDAFLSIVAADRA